MKVLKYESFNVRRQGGAGGVGRLIGLVRLGRTRLIGLVLLGRTRLIGLVRLGRTRRIGLVRLLFVCFVVWTRRLGRTRLIQIQNTKDKI